MIVHQGSSQEHLLRKFGEKRSNFKVGENSDHQLIKNMIRDVIPKLSGIVKEIKTINFKGMDEDFSFLTLVSYFAVCA